MSIVQPSGCRTSRSLSKQRARSVSPTGDCPRTVDHRVHHTSSTISRGVNQRHCTLFILHTEIYVFLNVRAGSKVNAYIVLAALRSLYV